MRVKYIKPIFMTICLVPSLAWSSSSGFTFKKLLTPNISSTPVENSQSTQSDGEFFGDVLFNSNQLRSDIGDVDGNRFYGQLDLGYSNTKSDIEKNVEFSARVNDEELLMFSVKSAYIKLNFSSDKQLILGRDTLDWSELDQTWSLGRLNNRVNFDGFNPDQEGLIGAKYVQKFGKNTKVEVFASYVYVPELNPGADINKDKGTVECNNPWANCVNPTAPVEGRDVPIFYNVNYPGISDLVLQYSAGMQVSHKYKKLLLSGYAIRKPENQIATPAEVVYDPNADQVFADISPDFYYHSVGGLEAHYDIANNLEVYGSLMSIVPDSQPEMSDKVYQYTGLQPLKLREDYAGAGVRYDNDGIFQSSFNYIARISSFDVEDELLVEYPRWSQAFHFNFFSRLSRNVSLGVDLKYDMLTEDRLAMFIANYEVSRGFTFSFGANMIGSSANTKSYWSNFSNNDSLYSALKYSF